MTENIVDASSIFDQNMSGLGEFSSGSDFDGGVEIPAEEDFSDFTFSVEEGTEEKQDFPEFQLIPDNTWAEFVIQSAKVVRTPFGNKDLGKPQLELDLDLTVPMKETYGNRMRPLRVWVPMYVPQDRTGGSIYPFKSLMEAAGLKKAYDAAKKSGKLPDTSGLQDAVLQAKVYRKKAKAVDSEGNPFINEQVSTQAGFIAKGAVPPTEKRQQATFKGD